MFFELKKLLDLVSTRAQRTHYFGVCPSLCPRVSVQNLGKSEYFSYANANGVIGANISEFFVSIHNENFLEFEKINV